MVIAIAASMVYYDDGFVSSDTETDNGCIVHIDFVD